MAQTRSYRAPYSQIVIVDPDGRAEVPDWKAGAVAVSTDTCILFACLAEIDGETEFTSGNMADVDPGSRPAFEGKLMTPSRKIALETAEGDAILQAPTKLQQTTVRIWANTEKEPDKVIVGIE